MAMISERSKPQYYDLVNGLGEVVIAHVAYSKVYKVLSQYETEHGEKLKIVLVE